MTKNIFLLGTHTNEKMLKTVFLDDGKRKLRIIDAIVTVLWKTDKKNTWPELSFPEIAELVSSLMGYPVSQPSIRRMTYSNCELFEKNTDDSPLHPRWRLSKAVKKNLVKSVL